MPSLFFVDTECAGFNLFAKMVRYCTPFGVSAWTAVAMLDIMIQNATRFTRFGQVLQIHTAGPPVHSSYIRSCNGKIRVSLGLKVHIWGGPSVQYLSCPFSAMLISDSDSILAIYKISATMMSCL